MGLFASRSRAFSGGQAVDLILWYPCRRYICEWSGAVEWPVLRGYLKRCPWGRVLETAFLLGSLGQGPSDSGTGSLRQGPGKTKSSAHNQSWKKCNQAHSNNPGKIIERIQSILEKNQAHITNVGKIKMNQSWKTRIKLTQSILEKLNRAHTVILGKSKSSAHDQSCKN